jgi:hypothetical protein
MVIIMPQYQFHYNPAPCMATHNSEPSKSALLLVCFSRIPAAVHISWQRQG